MSCFVTGATRVAFLFPVLSSYWQSSLLLMPISLKSDPSCWSVKKINPRPTSSQGKVPLLCIWKSAEPGFMLQCVSEMLNHIWLNFSVMLCLETAQGELQGEAVSKEMKKSKFVAHSHPLLTQTDCTIIHHSKEQREYEIFFFHLVQTRL